MTRPISGCPLIENSVAHSFVPPIFFIGHPLDRYFDRADGYIRIPGTNWTVFWYGQEGLKLMRDYIQICRDIPASFSNIPLKRT